MDLVLFTSAVFQGVFMNYRSAPSTASPSTASHRKSIKVVTQKKPAFNFSANAPFSAILANGFQSNACRETVTTSILPQGTPSKGWLKNPAWIDGGVNPPIFYHSHEEIAAVLKAHSRDEIMAMVASHSPDEVATAITSAQAAHPTPSIPTSTSQADTVCATEPSVAIDPQLQTSHDRTTLLDSAGHLFCVTMLFSVTEKGASRNAKPVMKKDKSIKMDYIVIKDSTRHDFIKGFLLVHDLLNQFSPGVYNSPSFKFSWTGSSGGKTVSVAVEALMLKDIKKVHVNVEFNINAMGGFRIRKPSIGHATNNTGEEELLYGTKVPRADLFSYASQLHGKIILDLKAKWPCAAHHGEHGEDGFCYVSPSAEHIHLNNRRFKMWASAIAAADATKHEPPNIVEFDGVRDARLPSTKPRGRSGPHSASQYLPAPPPSTSNDTMAMLMATLLPLLGSLGKRKRSPSPGTPPCRSQKADMTVLSPLPAVGSELRACLSDFAEQKGINMVDCEESLMTMDLTPDVIPDVPIARLCSLTNTITEGRIMKLQQFCREWQPKLEAKRRRLADNM